MRLAMILVVLAACEGKDDFPAAPLPIAWHEVPLVPVVGMLDGTGFRIDLPRGATQRAISAGETAFESNGLTVTLRVETEALEVDRAIERGGSGIVVVSKQVRPDGWVITYDTGKSTFGTVYVDDGALTCNAQANGDGTDWPKARTDALVTLCLSLKATTPLATAIVYPSGESPHERRAALCKLTLDQVAQVETSALAPPKGTRLTKQEVADRKGAADARAAMYAKRRGTCESLRWSEAELSCLLRVTKVAAAAACVSGW